MVDGSSSNRPGDSLNVKVLGDYDVPFDSVYVLGDEINEGCFGVVYKTHHISDPDETLAVKVIQRDCQDAEDEALHETEILRQVRHIQNVIELIDFYMDDEQMYIVQCLAGGGDVFDRLAQRKTYTENCARELATILLTTIGEIHKQKIVHRDLKPENLLLKDESSDYGILLCDFGLAKQLPETDDEGLTTFCGTPAYTAPEIIEGKDYREKVDMWSIGCILYALLSGNFPFGEESDGELYERICAADYDFDDEAWDSVSGSAKRVVRNLFELDPKKRWSAAEALASPWFKKDTVQLQETNLQRSLVGIKKICVRRKFKAACHVVQMSNRAMSFTLSRRNLMADASESSASERSKSFAGMMLGNGAPSKKMSLGAMILEAAAIESDSESDSEATNEDENDLVEPQAESGPTSQPEEGKSSILTRKASVVSRKASVMMRKKSVKADASVKMQSSVTPPSDKKASLVSLLKNAVKADDKKDKVVQSSASSSAARPEEKKLSLASILMKSSNSKEKKEDATATKTQSTAVSTSSAVIEPQSKPDNFNMKRTKTKLGPPKHVNDSSQQKPTPSWLVPRYNAATGINNKKMSPAIVSLSNTKELTKAETNSKFNMKRTKTKMGPPKHVNVASITKPLTAPRSAASTAPVSTENKNVKFKNGGANNFLLKRTKTKLGAPKHITVGQNKPWVAPRGPVQSKGGTTGGAGKSIQNVKAFETSKAEAGAWVPKAKLASIQQKRFSQTDEEKFTANATCKPKTLAEIRKPSNALKSNQASSMKKFLSTPSFDVNAKRMSCLKEVPSANDVNDKTKAKLDNRVSVAPQFLQKQNVWTSRKSIGTTLQPPKFTDSNDKKNNGSRNPVRASVSSSSDIKAMSSCIKNNKVTALSSLESLKREKRVSVAAQFMQTAVKSDWTSQRSMGSNSFVDISKVNKMKPEESEQVSINAVNKTESLNRLKAPMSSPGDIMSMVSSFKRDEVQSSLKKQEHKKVSIEAHFLHKTAFPTTKTSNSSISGGSLSVSSMKKVKSFGDLSEKPVMPAVSSLRKIPSSSFVNNTKIAGPASKENFVFNKRSSVGAVPLSVSGQLSNVNMNRFSTSSNAGNLTSKTSNTSNKIMPSTPTTPQAELSQFKNKRLVVESFLDSLSTNTAVSKTSFELSPKVNEAKVAAQFFEKVKFKNDAKQTPNPAPTPVFQKAKVQVPDSRKEEANKKCEKAASLVAKPEDNKQQPSSASGTAPEFENFRNKRLIVESFLDSLSSSPSNVPKHYNSTPKVNEKVVAAKFLEKVKSKASEKDPKKQSAMVSSESKKTNQLQDSDKNTVESKISLPSESSNFSLEKSAVITSKLSETSVVPSKASEAPRSFSTKKSMFENFVHALKTNSANSTTDQVNEKLVATRFIEKVKQRNGTKGTSRKQAKVESKSEEKKQTSRKSARFNKKKNTSYLSSRENWTSGSSTDETDKSWSQSNDSTITSRFLEKSSKNRSTSNFKRPLTTSARPPMSVTAGLKKNIASKTHSSTTSCRSGFASFGRKSTSSSQCSSDDDDISVMTETSFLPNHSSRRTWNTSTHDYSNSASDSSHSMTGLRQGIRPKVTPVLKNHEFVSKKENRFKKLSKRRSLWSQQTNLKEAAGDLSDTDMTESTWDCSTFLSDEMENIPETYSLDQIRSQSVSGLDYKNVEKYMSDKDFETVFGASREEVSTWQKWKVDMKKRRSQILAY